MRPARVPGKRFVLQKSDYFSESCEKIRHFPIILCAVQPARRIHLSVAAMQKKILARRLRKARNA
jgi:hypothetical protein